jgi:hypothetical protein
VPSLARRAGEAARRRSCLTGRRPAATGTAELRGIAFPQGGHFGDSPWAELPGGATITLLGLDGADGIPVISVVWDENAT